MTTIDHQVTIVMEECINCGTLFGIDQTLQTGLRRSGRTFYCPNGHPQVYADPIENRLARANKELKLARENEAWWKDRANREANEKEMVKRSLTATKGQLTKTRKRLAGGACPCCNRQFTNLQRHMASKHPEYAGDAPNES